MVSAPALPVVSFWTGPSLLPPGPGTEQTNRRIEPDLPSVHPRQNGGHGLAVTCRLGATRLSWLRSPARADRQFGADLAGRANLVGQAYDPGQSVTSHCRWTGRGVTWP